MRKDQISLPAPVTVSFGKALSANDFEGTLLQIITTTEINNAGEVFTGIRGVVVRHSDGQIYTPQTRFLHVNLVGESE